MPIDWQGILHRKIAKKDLALKCVVMNISDEDKSHMHNIGYGGIMRTITPDDVAEKLIASGHVRIAAGGLMLTELGYKSLGKPTIAGK